ncbi:uncharacterized protein LOC115216338 [Argonauta hians]
MLFLPIILLILTECCFTRAEPGCNAGKAKEMLQKLKNIPKTAATFGEDQMMLLSKSEFNLKVVSCPWDQAKPLYKEHEKAMKKALQYYENECPQFLEKLKHIQRCRAKLVPNVLFSSGITHFCRQFDHCSHLRTHSCPALRNVSLVANYMGSAATEICKVECKTKAGLLNQLNNCWGFMTSYNDVQGVKSGNFNGFYQCISSHQRQNCSLSQTQVLRIFPLFSHENPDLTIERPAINDCVSKWRVLEDQHSWPQEICNELIRTKDCILNNLKEERKEILSKISCRCFPPYDVFPKFDVFDPEHGIHGIASVSSSGRIFDGPLVKTLTSVAILLVTSLSFAL